MRLGDTACRVLGAVLTLHARNGRVTVRDVAGEVGFDVAWTHENLVRLRDAGLVTWEDNRTATIRPTCAVVSHVERLLGATLRAANESGGGAVDAAPRRGQPLRRGADMAGLYPGTPTHAQGRR